MGRDTSVGIATRCGLDGPGIESGWGRDFLQTGSGAHAASYTMDIGLFPGVACRRYRTWGRIPEDQGYGNHECDCLLSLEANTGLSIVP